MPDARVVDYAGNLLTVDDLFVDEGYSRSVVKTRMYEDYLLLGSKTRTRRLLFAEGFVVDRDTANALRAQVAAVHATLAAAATTSEPSGQ